MGGETGSRGHGLCIFAAMESTLFKTEDISKVYWCRLSLGRVLKMKTAFPGRRVSVSAPDKQEAERPRSLPLP